MKNLEKFGPLRSALFGLVAAFILGCAHGQTVQQRLNSKVGKNIDDVIADAGTPTSTYPVHSGRLYVWKSAGADPAKSGECEVQYETDANGVVVAATFQGGCK